jgi:hypothetical protein
LESKRLKLEERRIQEQAQALNKAVDSACKLRMEALQQRRVAIERYFDSVQQELGHLHIERMAVLEMAKEAHRRVLEPGLSAEERACFKELASELSSKIPGFGEQANASLATLLKALPGDIVPDRLLLTDGDE